MENEGGRKLVESGKMCERKNGRGVDPNRNWPLDWGRKEPDYDPNEEYPGTKPFRWAPAARGRAERGRAARGRAARGQAARGQAAFGARIG